METLHQKYGNWALVTGASSGIGEEFARQLAFKGFHLILTARRKPKLEKLADELNKKYGTKTHIIQADLSEQQGVQTVINSSLDYDVGLLVNNAGAESNGEFLDDDIYKDLKVNFLNMTAPMLLSHHFANKMKDKRRGAILFVASVVGYSSVPYLANYSATKAYVLSLGESLNYEFKKYGIDVTTLNPGVTKTEMSESMSEGIDFSKTPIEVMHVTDVVKTGLDTIGKKAVVIPGFRNNAFTFYGTRILSRIGISKFWAGILEKAMVPRNRNEQDEVKLKEIPIEVV